VARKAAGPNPEQLLERAKERFEADDYYGCIHLLDELIESGQAFADAHQLRGAAYFMLGQPQRALESLDRALEENPRYLEALIHRAIVLGSMGRSEEAEATFGRARAIAGDTRAGIPAHYAAKLANQHAALGEAYAEAGALERAIEQYRVALELGPSFHDLRYRLAQLLLDAGRALEAREELERVAAARPGAVEVRAALGLACYLSGDATRARRVWEELGKERPDDVRIRVYLAMLNRAPEG
jgi:tetratricopeptide (TPR) repeat protein